jgi:tetratricopeptide (TPR) repeat protein
VSSTASTSTPPRQLRSRSGQVLAVGAAVLVSAWLPSVLAQSTTSAAVSPADATPAPASSAPAAPASPVDAYAAFRREFDAGRYVEAVTEAQRVLAFAEQQATTPAAEDVQVALMNLGMAQNLADDFLGAETTYKRAIKLIESSGRPLHARLARAHAGLATAYHDSKRHELAVQSFDQAIALTRRHEGLLTGRQVPLVEKYIDSLTELGRYQDALQAQKYLLRIAVREHGETSVELVPRLEEIGRWYTTVGAYDQSRRLLKQAIAIVETAEGDRSQRLVGPLLALAACNRRQLLDPRQQQGSSPDSDRANRFNDPMAPMVPSGYSSGMMVSEGEKSLLRAAAITDALPEPAPAQVVNVRTQLGDWYQLRVQPERALANYTVAWAAAKRMAEPSGPAATELVFGKPVLLQVVRPEGWDRHASKPVDTLEVRTVVIEATIDAAGRAIDAKIIDDSGDARRADRTLKALTETGRYRPRFENGEPVVTRGVRFEQPWILELPKEEPAKPGS